MFRGSVKDQLRSKLAVEEGFISEEEGKELLVLRQEFDALAGCDELDEDEQSKKCALCKRLFFLDEKISVLAKLSIFKRDTGMPDFLADILRMKVLAELEDVAKSCPIPFIAKKAMIDAFEQLRKAEGLGSVLGRSGPEEEKMA